VVVVRVAGFSNHYVPADGCLPGMLQIALSSIAAGADFNVRPPAIGESIFAQLGAGVAPPFLLL